MTIRRLLGGAASLLSPRGCVVCRAWIRESKHEALLCGICRTRLSVPTWPRCPRCHHPAGTGRQAAEDCLECSTWPDTLALARSAYVLETPASEMVHAFKYEGWKSLGDEMGRAISSVVIEQIRLEGDTVVVPMPTTARRIRQRGYNQAAVLAEVVSREVELPLLVALTRPSAARSQTSLDPDQRRENVREAFRLAPAIASDALEGVDVILIDDVLTTGATAGAAARILAAAGARRVAVATFARAMPRRRDVLAA